MIKNWLITGDTHRDFSRFRNLPIDNPEETAIIVLGDAGINYCLDDRDYYYKKHL